MSSGALATRGAGAAVAVRSYPPGALENCRRAVADLARGVAVWRIWVWTTVLDLAGMYRVNLLGPFWNVLLRTAMILVIVVLFGDFFRAGRATYLPHVAAGMVVWQLIRSLLTGACRTFSDCRDVIVQTELPLSMHACRRVLNQLVLFAHSLTIILAVMVLYGINPGWPGWLALGGCAVIALNGLWAALLFGVLAIRYPGFRPLVSRAARGLFFLTPIIWMPDQLPRSTLLADLVTWNPVYHLIEVVRGPLLGQAPTAQSWAIVGAVTVVGWCVALAVFAQVRGRIAHWL